jgi:zinc transport system substrate-binding protein
MLAVALLGSACGGDGDEASPGSIGVVASAYPLVEAAERVGGDLVSVRNLTPPGVEPHDLELAPDDLEALLSADLVLYVGGGFQPAVEEAAGEGEGRAVDVLSGVATLPPPGSGAEAADPQATVDPHVWLDPTRYATIVEEVADALSAVDPSNADSYRANAEAFAAELDALDAGIRAGLATCSSRTIVVSHAAFTYLADAYGLRQEAISGIAPESEPDPARLAELKEFVEREGITTVFTEELVPPEVAETLAREAGVATAVLDPLEGLTQAQLDAGEDYGSVMRRNLETLRGALDCR